MSDLYHGCCRGSVECSVRERELYAGGKLDGIYLFFREITKSMTQIARIQSKYTHYKLRLLFQISISTAHIHSLDSATGEPDSHTHSSHSNESQNHPAQDSLRVKSRERAYDLLACPSLHSP